MNYFEFIDLLMRASLAHPLVNNVYINRYKLNDENDIKYPAIVILGSNSTVQRDTTTHYFNILYVDRLTSSRYNSIEIHSTGMQAITEIVNAIRARFRVGIDTLSFETFNEAYADNTAGVIARNVQFTIPSILGECDFIDSICNC